MNPLAMAALILGSIGLFLWQVRDKLRVLFKLRPAARFDALGRRTWLTLGYAFAQKRMFRRPLAGLAHIVIFAAFVVTVLNEVTYWVRGFDAAFTVPLPPVLAEPYAWLRDVVWSLALGGVLYWLVMRALVRPWRLRTSAHQLKAFVILGFIATLAVTELLLQGAELGGRTTPWEPASSFLSTLLAGAPPSTLQALITVCFWLHVSIVLVFLNFLPLGKHFHVLFAVPNVFTMRLEPRGFLDPSMERLEKEEKFGIATAADLTWKQAVDTYTCTECGRCLESCPTALTDKPLTHRDLNLALKGALAAATPNLLSMAKDGPAKDKPALPELVGEEGAAIHPDTVWACTTCGSCELECPVFIDQVPRIIQLRQNLVMIRGEFPTELGRTFKGLEQHSNPWGLGADGRDAWSEGLDIPRAKDIATAGGEIPLLYWIGCAGSFDERTKKITLAMVKLLRAAGVPFCILGKEEGCTGDPARRLGNEYLFQTLATTNIEMLKGYKVKRILTHCPHCLQTLKNDYASLGGGDWNVVHHSELLSELVRDGKLQPKHGDVSAVFHDSCYLTRYNGISEAPRQVLRSSLRVLEFDNHGDKAVCCGAGGGRFWMEEKIGKRINHARLEDGLAKKPDVVASACPFCLTMLGDGIKDKGLEESVRARDISEILADAIS